MIHRPSLEGSDVDIGQYAHSEEMLYKHTRLKRIFAAGLFYKNITVQKFLNQAVDLPTRICDSWSLVHL